MVFIEISQNSQENSRARVFCNIIASLGPATLLKRDSGTGFSCEFCKISKNTFLWKTSGGCFCILSNENLYFVKTTKEAKQPSLLIKTIMTVYLNIFPKKNFLLYKIYVKIKISFSKTLIKVVLLWLLRKQIIQIKWGNF